MSADQRTEPPVLEKSTAWTEDDRRERAEQAERDDYDAYERDEHGNKIQLHPCRGEPKVEKATAWTEDDRREMAEQAERDNYDAYERDAQGNKLQIQPRRESPSAEHPEARAIRVMAAEFEKLGAEPCSECGYALNEIRDYVHELLALRKVAEAARVIVSRWCRCDYCEHTQQLDDEELALRDALSSLSSRTDGGGK